MRPGMLPLSAGGVLLGILLATADYQVDFWTAVLIVLTTICLQILSNLSDALGDMLHGTDTPERQGPQRGLNGGDMTIPQMKGLIALFVVLCIVSGTAMIYHSFGTLLDIGRPVAAMDWTPTLLLLLGAGAIMGAMKYSPGRNRGLGDLFAFLLFGIVAVGGAYLVASHTLFLRIFLPGAAVGCFSIGVLNVNSIRPGERRAGIYQTALIVLGWGFMVAYCLLRWHSWWHYLYFLTLPFFVLHLRGVWARHNRDLAPRLPLLVLSTFFFCLLAGMGFCAHLLF